MEILQTSDRAVLNWDSFSIGATESVRFVQPGATSAALNRVTSLVPSQIDGLLQASGQVLLINPNGIVVGPTGMVDAAGFLASTLDVSDGAFLAGGDLPFLGDSQASVVNLGTISASSGDVFLIGRRVENVGSINAPLGDVGLAAGSDILLRVAGEERILVRAGGSEAAPAEVVNSGTITAVRAELKASAGNPYALAVNTDGIDPATGVTTTPGGRVFLGSVEQSGAIVARRPDGSGGRVTLDSGSNGKTLVSGSIDASSTTGAGGEIAITGQRVEILPTAVLDASGVTTGGEIHVGGGFQGADPTIQNALQVSVSAGSQIRASGGSGGEVIVWSDGFTEFAGFADVKALAPGGSGGAGGGFGPEDPGLPGDGRSLGRRAGASAPGHERSRDRSADRRRHRGCARDGGHRPEFSPHRQRGRKHHRERAGALHQRPQPEPARAGEHLREPDHPELRAGRPPAGGRLGAGCSTLTAARRAASSSARRGWIRGRTGTTGARSWCGASTERPPWAWALRVMPPGFMEIAFW